MAVGLYILVLVLGFALLIKGADLLVAGGASLARRLRISELVIGLTVFALGTSAPELMVGGVSSLQDAHDIVFGNVIGSNIFNTLLVLGVAGLIRPLAIRTSTTRYEIPYSVAVVLVAGLLVNDVLSKGEGPNVLSREDGLILIGLFVLYLVYALAIARRGAREDVPEDILSKPRTAAYLIAGCIALPLGGDLVVDSATDLAHLLGVSDQLIGLTIVAGGTSLPELAATSVAAYRGRSDMAVGTVVGSNIFNVLLILGTAGCIKPVTYPTVFNLDGLVFVGASALVFTFIFTGAGRRISRPEAALLLLAFLAYQGYLIAREYGLVHPVW